MVKFRVSSELQIRLLRGEIAAERKNRARVIRRILAPLAQLAEQLTLNQ
jgi:hypothetical protein